MESEESKQTPGTFVLVLDRLYYREFMRFLRYSVVGFSTFMFDFAMVLFLVNFFETPLYPTIVGCFVTAATANYFISRFWVFAGTHRGILVGYVYFLCMALIAGTLIAGIVWFLVEYTGIAYAVARIGAAGVVGIANYLFNLVINFNMVGKKLR